jgi:hypothetical protein
MCPPPRWSASRRASRRWRVAERRVEIVAVGREAVELRALGACSDCGGCDGRCRWFRTALPDDGLRLPGSAFPRPPAAGETWRLQLGDRELLQQALRGHGAALLGLICGALAGHIAAAASSLPLDAATAIGALLGTLLALRISKRAPGAALRLLPDAI